MSRQPPCSRSAPRTLALAFVLVGTAALSVGCAHGPSAAPAADDMAEVVELPFVPTPQTQQEARRALELAFAAENVGDLELSAAQLHAVLASDFLTDMGRMNVYWQLASAHHRLLDVEGEQDALEGFLLAAQLVDLSEDDEARAAMAESKLIRLSRRSASMAGL